MSTTSATSPPQGLCPSFRTVSSKIYGDLERGRRFGLVPWETSLTDYLLLTLASLHPREILARRFDQRAEGRIGADWEWWFRDANGYAGFRVQAKRRNPGQRVYGLKQRVAGSTQLQAERFHARAARQNLTALYCLYSDLKPDDLSGPIQVTACVHAQGQPDSAQWGCALLSARAALRHAKTRRISHELVLQDARPMFHLVCDDRGPRAASASPGLTETVRLELRELVLVQHRPRRQTDEPDIDDGEMEQELALASQSGANPPPTVRRAFEERDVGLVQPRPTLGGVVLVDGLS